ncbi:ATP-binding protein [Archangium lansingense]|uniref:histidine kinase n=1 Tax=Archangium lansingense TaxID=2995310 RepID=A0ABT4A021_9BACT|nr:ATP-binding protein [Archangium lansinium]MCY1074980.1 ATP-binding protein [Archangium lansinium]
MSSLSTRTWPREGGLRAWFLEGLDQLLSEEQRRLPPEELGRLRVLVGAAALNLVMAVQMTVSGLSSRERSFYLVAGPLVLAGYLSVLVLARRGRSPRLASLLLCSILGVGMLAAMRSMGVQQASTHAATMLLPALAAYLLGARMGLAFTVLFGLNALLLQPLQQVGFELSRPLFPDEMAQRMSLLAGFSLLGGWALNWLHVTAREASHSALQRALKTLRESESKLLSLFESTDDLVMSLDRQGRLLTANPSMRQLLRRTLGREGQPGEPILDAFPLEIQEHLRGPLTQALAGQRAKTEASFQLGDRLLIVEIVINPILEEGGGVVGLTFFGRDITERKEAESRLAELHRSLLDVSRRAGMAEIATGVLHNVGNTLNSVNVSAGVVAERLRALRVSGLTKTAELLREHSEAPGSLLTANPQLRQVPGYLHALAEQLMRERDAVLDEVRVLDESVEHIKSVVSMQQQHACFAGVVERVELPCLIDDAMRLHAVSYEQLGIQLRREYGTQLSAVMVDRHKLLQILVNLLSNARHALMDSGRADKQLLIRVEQAGERLRIIVKENGVGIVPENLVRLFTQGFSTKKDGHGFGLHISALAARELGGELHASSEGPGQGATFTLELPLTDARVSEARGSEARAG